MRLAIALALAVLALAAPAVAAPPAACGPGETPASCRQEPRVRAVPAADRSDDSLPAWLLPTSVVAVLLLTVLATRRL
jgi:hypothetical protein